MADWIFCRTALGDDEDSNGDDEMPAVEDGFDSCSPPFLEPPPPKKPPKDMLEEGLVNRRWDNGFGVWLRLVMRDGNPGDWRCLIPTATGSTSRAQLVFHGVSKTLWS